jgi:hypothetical protein
VGIDFVTGFAKGISDSVGTAVDAAKDLAGSVVDKVRNVLDSHSPSRVMIGIGGDIPTGLAIGIEGMSKMAVTSAKNMVQDTVSQFDRITTAIADALYSDMDFTPVITPVIDMSKVDAGVSELSKMYKGVNLKLNTSMDSAAKVKVAPPGSSQYAAQQQVVASEPKTVNFTQNNYSPKELARVDIYRQTKNLLLKKGSLSA